MFSCLWQLWEWIDPGKMDKFQQQKPYETPPQSSINQSTHPQYYQQIYNKTHAIQSSHQLNHAQRSSQHYPQYSSDQSIRTPQQETPKQPSNKPKTKENEKKQLRSPSARRPPNAPVSMQGWLHKQGSEGLMLWKKRWFVLSEYCLFYYKGLEEEKVLGSILLPSYKVSACGPDDKVNRKFAFKCEHVNMRTYILAADSQELMQQWIHVLSLACNLQNNLEPRKELRIPQTISDPESFKSNTSSAQSYLKNPIHNHTVSNTTDLSNSSLQELNQYNQPLYANAPPKPRRLVDGYCSPGPEILDRYPHYSKSPSYVKYLQEPMYLDNRIFVGAPNIDRRTPDTYGRNNTSKFRNISDYEDIYMEQNAYKRPLSPGALDNLKKVYPTVNVGYPIKSYGPPMEMLRPGFYPEQMRRPPIQTISRPHSADFLEYKSNKLDPVPSVIPVIQQPRPKSSLDINMYSKDAHSFPRPNNYFVDIQKDNDYFYSQERYAEKMRKSAQYLHKMPPAAVKYYQPASGYEYQSNFREELSNLQPVRSRSALSEGSLLCSQDIENDTLSRDYFPSQDVNLSTEQSVRVSADQFARSASARLSQNNPFEENVTRIEGERKREESMKRLLEWKQRMLQSPLNRKAQAQGYRGYPRKENAYAYAQKQKKVALPTRRSVHDLVQYNSYSSDDEASGSISISAKDNLGRDTFPRAVTSKRSITPTMQSRSITNLDRSSYKNLTAYPGWHYCDQQDPNRALQNDIAPKGKLHVSAGELLGRTHEELVLLLIQLRRQQAQTFQAIESCYNEIDALQLHLRNLDQLKRLENLQKLERIKQNLLELEKQYEKRKPLVNLVDNMVKLGTLYRNPNERSEVANQIRERLEFNQYIQERRLMADEKRDWNRIEPSHMHLQEKVRQLYQLDSLIQEESRNLHNLQKGKEDIERALGGLRQKLLKGLNNPEEIEQARRQQYILENELSRVHLMLAQNSKKLEETVAGNARLEQELLVLKQKLQLARQQRMSPQFSNAGDSLPYLSGQALETDLERVQKKIGDLQKQREELSLQVRQLTDRSNIPNTYNHKNVSPLENQTINSTNKKKPTSSWRETDLDTMNSIDHGYDSYSSSSTTPLYINTDPKPSDFHCKAGSDSTSDDTTFSSNPMEKPEIKTVRIVKRESERRQRDREKTFNGKCEALLEEDDSSQGSSILFRPTSLNFKPKPPELSPVFKSEAARQIITEVSRKSPSAQGQRRAVPQERRRHHTAPHDNLVLLGSLDGRRARDDLDIERALRQRVDAPDLVRSTLSTKELKYNEETIDNILSTPNKIFIPERYIPEQMPQPTEEEQEKRKKKVESIKKMLSDTAIISTTATNDNKSLDKKLNAIGKCASASSILEEKKQREHLLQLNQILAKQVMEMSKVVAVKSFEEMRFALKKDREEEDEDSSPVAPLPLYQQRENFYS